ncbi:MAG TPA: STAS domain-containing protein [Candidatus Desulfobacillus sp.]|nr:STAS domain-containing protein [Candidatus Desulfobacillus sp.]
MAFSLFGKKPEAPTKPAAKKPAAAAPPRPSPVRPAVEPQPAPEKDGRDLDFTAPGTIAPQEEDAPGRIELQEHSANLHPVVEEAAILFANSQDEAALAALEGAVDAGPLGKEAGQVWAMLFDLYQFLGYHDQFEKRALEYSVKYEKSPPAWVEPAAQALGPALSTGGTAFIAFAGKLDATAEKSVRQMERIIGANPVARIDFGRLQAIDAAGAEMLLQAMRAARKLRCELVLNGAGRLADLLKAGIETGRRDNEMHWLLLLELFQHMAQQEAFEEWAVEYAVTFEVSPPSWETLPKKPKQASVPAAEPAPEPAETDTFRLSGEMFSAGSDAFRKLTEHAAGRRQVLIDCRALKRMDFVSTGLFLNTLTNLQMNGCGATLREPNHLLHALFGVLGIDQVARIEPRKF